jgi:hypothetical protein
MFTFIVIITYIISSNTPSAEELRMKIFITKQAINKLKDEISKAKESKNGIAASSSDENSLNFKEKDDSLDNIETSYNMTDFNGLSNFHEFNSKTLDEDVRKDILINTEVVDYFNHNPKHLELDHVKKEIKQSGIKEINDLIDMIDNHPEQIGHGTPNTFFNLQDYNKTDSNPNVNLKSNTPNININSQKFVQVDLKQSRNLPKNRKIRKNIGNRIIKNGPIL